MFGFFKKKKVDATPKVAPLSTAIAGSIISAVGARGIPTMPGSAQKAFQLATDPNAEATDFVEVIESDEALSARVIKIANSVYFDRGKASKTIEESVLVIGINELRNLLSATTLSEIFPSKHPLRRELWAHDIATALCARALARQHSPNDADAAFLGGLMHDIGKLLLLQRTGPDYLKAVELVQSRGISFSEAEHERFVFDHTEVGQLIGERWHFGPDLITIIRNHHKELDASAPLEVTTIVTAADLMAHALGLGHSNVLLRLRKPAEEQLEKILELFKLPLNERRSFLQGIQRSFEVEYDLYAGSNKQG